MTTDITVPLIDLQAQYAPIREEVRAVMDEVCDSQWFVMGPHVKGLEDEISAYTGAQARRGVRVGLRRDHPRPHGGRHRVQRRAQRARPLPVVHLLRDRGLGPPARQLSVYVDIDPVTYNMDPEKVRETAKNTENLAAIMPVHLFGQCVDMTVYKEIADEFGVPLIEDAAQAIGSKDETGAMAGSRGDVGCFSFFPTKNLGGFGDGGIVTTNDDDLAHKMTLLRNHGMEPKYYHPMLGLNSRLDALQAAVLRIKLRHLESWHDGRRANADFYDKAFAEAGAQTSDVSIDEGGDLPLRTPARPESSKARHIYNQYVIRVPAEHRDALRAHLTEHKIGTEVYYPVPLHMQECMAWLGQSEGSLPESERAALETIALPIYPELTAEQKQHVVDSIVGYLREHAGAGKGAVRGGVATAG